MKRCMPAGKPFHGQRGTTQRIWQLGTSTSTRTHGWLEIQILKTDPYALSSGNLWLLPIMAWDQYPAVTESKTLRALFVNATRHVILSSNFMGWIELKLRNENNIDLESMDIWQIAKLWKCLKVQPSAAILPLCNMEQAQICHALLGTPTFTTQLTTLHFCQQLLLAMEALAGIPGCGPTVPWLKLTVSNFYSWNQVLIIVLKYLFPPHSVSIREQVI